MWLLLALATNAMSVWLLLSGTVLPVSSHSTQKVSPDGLVLLWRVSDSMLPLLPTSKNRKAFERNISLGAKQGGGECEYRGLRGTVGVDF